MGNTKQPVVIAYTGSQEVARRKFLAQAPQMAKKGYYPVSETWEDGKYGCGAFLIALLLCVILIGVLVFIYMIIVKPPGKLTVTYEFKDAATIANEQTKICPQCAETVKLAAQICRYCRYEFNSTETNSDDSAEGAGL